jgi:hypothetical protein
MASMKSDNWLPVVEELSRWRAAGRTARLWLRDDDAVEPTAALDRLVSLAELARAPVMLAVIPMRATPALAARVSESPWLMPAMHGAWHRNHAPVERKKEETPLERGEAIVRVELGTARTRLIAMFGPAAGRFYVPPWNRIVPEIAALLPEIGFESVSTFGPKTPLASARLHQINTHVDLMDWQGGRVGHPSARVANMLAEALARARADGFREVGVLAHHLVHDKAAWVALDDLIRFVAGRDDIVLAPPPT